MNQNKLLIPVICLFLFFQGILFVFHSFPITKHETDGLHYMTRSHGEVFNLDPFHGPGYPIFIRLFRTIGLSSFSSAKTVSIISGFIFIMACWFILKKVSTPFPVLICFLIIVFNKSIVTCSNMILSDMLASGCFLFSIAILIYPKRVHYSHSVIAGVLAGTAYLTRYIYLFELLLPILYYLSLGKKIPLNQKAKNSFAFYSAFAIIIAPWSAYLYKLKGNIFWNLNHLNIAFNLVRDSNDWASFPTIEQYPNLTSVLLQHPFLITKSWLHSLMTLPGWIMKLFPVIGIFAFIGFYTWCRHIDPTRRFLGYISACYLFLISFVWYEYRFLIPLTLILSILIADGIHFTTSLILDWLNRKRKDMKSEHLLLFSILFMLLIIIPTLKHTHKRFSDIPFEYKVTSERLLGLCSTDDLIFAAKPHIAVFAQTKNYEFRNAGLDDASWSEFPKILKQINPSYVIYDERYAFKKFPELHPLITPESKPYPHLLQHVFTVSKPQKLVVYKYRKPARYPLLLQAEKR